MISSEDVRRVTFDKAMRGYRCDDVDDYLKQVAESMDALAAQNDDLQKKLVVLAQRIDQYRAEEDTLRTTMINAQRLGDNVIREAKQKAAEIIRAANIKAEDREQRVQDDVALAQQEIVTLKAKRTASSARCWICTASISTSSANCRSIKSRRKNPPHRQNRLPHRRRNSRPWNRRLPMKRRRHSPR